MMRDLLLKLPYETALLPPSWTMDPYEREIERTFDRLLKDFDRDIKDFWRPAFLVEVGPAIELEDTEDELRVTAEMPGLEKDDFKVELEGDRLIIEGEKKTVSKTHKGEAPAGATHYGAFRRTLALPCPVKLDEIKAEYRNGELTIHLPKAEEARTRTIEVQVA